MPARKREHDSFKRLFEGAKEATAHERKKDLRVTDQASLAKRLNVSLQVLGNWATRGVSQDGAIRAEAAFGLSPNWVLSGRMPVSPPPAPPPGFEDRRLVDASDWATLQATKGTKTQEEIDEMKRHYARLLKQVKEMQWDSDDS